MAGFEPTASKSQTSRATSCATPRLVEIFDFLGQIRKWSNLWSKVFCRSTRRRKSEKTRGKRRFCELSAVGSRGGHTLPNHARYQLRYIPILFSDRLGGACFLFSSAQSLVWKKAPPGVQMSARTPRLLTVLADLYARAFARTVRCFSLFLG